MSFAIQIMNKSVIMDITINSICKRNFICHASNSFVRHIAIRVGIAGLRPYIAASINIKKHRLILCHISVSIYAPA